MSREEVSVALPPMAGARDEVLAWLGQHGITDISESFSGDMIQASIPVKTAETMFGTQFYNFINKEDSMEVLRASTPYTVPANVAEKLYLVGNLVQLPAFKRKIGMQGNLGIEAGSSSEWPADCGRACNGLVTPGVLAAAYKLGDAPGVAGTSRGMSTAEFQGVNYDDRDLSYFQKTCATKQNITVDKLIGSNTGIKCKLPLFSQTCLEALLDIEYIKAVGGGIPLTNIYVKEFSLLNWAMEVDALDDKDLPMVHSLSYGNDERQQTSAAFMDSVNAQFMKLGARGVSLLAASGDQGVWGRSGVYGSGRFNPDFPAGSPYITAVGGTDFVQKGVIGDEKVWTSGGGGFSDHFPIPEYQKNAVAAYKSAAASQKVLPDESLYNNTGRGYPDVAALGGTENMYCVAAGSFISAGMTGIAGTSASCPVVSAMFARLNDIRLSKNKPPMGFLNPFIYQNKGAFNDVKQGTNSDSDLEKRGFEAIAGWDPATGMGTPDFEKLTAAALRASAGSTLVV
jgi:tripeptidyl-peptidase-1